MPSPLVHDPDCELCRADRFTHWYVDDEHGWVADCEACGVPMVVWHGHGPLPPDEIAGHLIATLEQVAVERFGPTGWSIDRHMRQVPDHFHAHARDTDWWAQRFTRPLSRYTGVGGERTEIVWPGASGDAPAGSV